MKRVQSLFSRRPHDYILLEEERGACREEWLEGAGQRKVEEGRRGSVQSIDQDLHVSCTHTDDSDVDMLSASGDEPNGAGRVNNLITSHQPIVHFEGSIREPVTPREYNLDFTSKDSVKKYVTCVLPRWFMYTCRDYLSRCTKFRSHRADLFILFPTH